MLPKCLSCAHLRIGDRTVSPVSSGTPYLCCTCNVKGLSEGPYGKIDGELPIWIDLVKMEAWVHRGPKISEECKGYERSSLCTVFEERKEKA